MQVIMEIQYKTQKARLFEPPTYREWFDGHNYDWRLKNRTFAERPSREFTEMHQKAIARFLKQQGKMIKIFMQNCNGHKEK